MSCRVSAISSSFEDAAFPSGPVTIAVSESLEEANAGFDAIGANAPERGRNPATARESFMVTLCCGQ